VAATESASAPVVLATKLHAPSGRADVVSRPALVERLTSGLAGKLTLVAAPPGWGKTTLLGEWRAAAPGRFAWLSLDADDNDPARFWTYLIEALRTVEPELGATPLAQLRGPSTGILEVVLPALINELTGLQDRLVLVLDDYHLIASRDVHEQVAFLVEHLPPQVHLVVSSRADPPLPLARLRARREMNELRAGELRFSSAEALALLNEALGLGLAAADVERLRVRTEGWAAGLYLAALSLRGRPDAPAFVAEFAGDDRHIVDYLSSEVLESQPDETQTFLLHTSVLERLCGPLCDVVTGGTGSAEVLEEIERSNLFLVPLDNTREWYRYHRLFSELLRHELSQREPDVQPLLHRRAWVWLREAGLVPEAVQHAIAASDLAEAADLVADHWNEYFNQGQLTMVADWLDALELAGAAADPRLAVARAWIAMDRGRLDEVERWLDAAAAGEPLKPLADAVATLRLVHHFKAGDVGRAREAAEGASEREPEESPFGATVARILLGVTRYWSGDGRAALAALEDASRLARGAGNDLGAIYALGYRAAISAEAGELEEAEKLADEALSLADEPAPAEHFVTMMAHLARATVLLGRGRAEAADEAAGRGLELSRRGAGLLEQAYALAVAARTRESEEARALLAEARAAVERSADPGILAELLTSAKSKARPVVAIDDELSERELVVLRLLDSELSQREIGRRLFVSLNTVKSHVKSIFRKLGATSRSDAVARARERGLL
jgi:LuxR family maltose regulon positive regulatory protein